MGSVTLSADELELLNEFRTAVEMKHADLEISIKGGRLAKIYVKNKKLFNRQGQLKEGTGETV